MTWWLTLTWVAILFTWAGIIQTFRSQRRTRQLLRETRRQLDAAHQEQLTSLHRFFGRLPEQTGQEPEREQ